MTNLLISSAIIALLAIGLGIIRLRRLSIDTLIFSVVGAVVGLLLGALASAPLSKLPNPAGQVLPLLVSGVLTIIFIPIVLSQRRAVMQHLPFIGKLQQASVDETATPLILVDTSVIIDGRIADIARAGFVPGRLLIPRFVLAELQNIADSEDALRRGRGRRGLEVLSQLQETLPGQVDITDQDAPGIKEVDAKLVALANQLHAHVLTTDYNLNRVAQIQGVRVLNVNELSNAIRPVVIPGEELLVRIVQAGKEKNQGVGYLADGTMIVVENGDKLIGQELPTEVTRVFQTVAGKMIFAVPKKGREKGRSNKGTPTSVSTELAMEEIVSTPVEAKPIDQVHPSQDRPVRPNHSDRGSRSSRHSRHKSSPEDRLIEEVNGQQS